MRTARHYLYRLKGFINPWWRVLDEQAILWGFVATTPKETLERILQIETQAILDAALPTRISNRAIDSIEHKFAGKTVTRGLIRAIVRAAEQVERERKAFPPSPGKSGTSS